MKEKYLRKIGYHESNFAPLRQVQLTLGPKATLSEIRNAAARICRDYLTGKWKNVRTDELIVKRISGGLSNFLYYVALPETDTTESRKRSLETVNDLHSTAIYSEKNNFDEVSSVENHVIGNASKRQRTESGSSVDNLNSFANKRYSSNQSHNNEPKQVMLRIYGQSHGEDALEAMITESVVFALLSERNFGPKLHGIFPGGRIEQYIPARALATQELSDERISKKIAEKMAEIHSLNIPMSKEPDWIWNCMERWLISVDNLLKNESPRENIAFSIDFSAEAEWLREVIDKENFLVCFCHNDLQEGNILFMEPEKSQVKLRDDVFCMHDADNSTNFDESSQISVDSIRRRRIQQSTNNNQNNIGNVSINNQLYQLDNEIDNTRDSALSINSCSFVNAEDDWEHDNNNKEPNLMIIDFEYCAYNYRGFDLANHFLEWTFDYTNPQFPYFYHHKHQYPNAEQRKLFITTYLRKQNFLRPDYEPSSQEIEKLEREVYVFTMLSHFFWSLWSIVNVSSNIEFGYWEYAETRLQEYKKLKEEFLKKHPNVNNNN